MYVYVVHISYMYIIFIDMSASVSNIFHGDSDELPALTSQAVFAKKVSEDAAWSLLEVHPSYDVGFIIILKQSGQIISTSRGDRTP